MGFSRSLYYPNIDIRDKKILNNAALFWEGISTIVPETHSQPYKLDDTIALAEEGILTPLTIHPHSREIYDIGREAIDYFSSQEAELVLLPPSVDRHFLAHKLEAQLKRVGTIYHEKMAPKIVEELIFTGQARRFDNRLEMDLDFANYYMTLLACRLARQKGLALLTHEQRFENLSNKFRRGDAMPNGQIQNEVAVGLLANLAIELAKIDPETPIKDIILFRKRHNDELAKFRYEINQLINGINNEYESYSALQQSISFIYTNRVLPAINDLTKSLKSFHIRYLKSIITTIAFCSPILPAITSTPIALFGGLGASIIANKINYRLDRKQELRNNPYSYVLSLQQSFS